MARVRSKGRHICGGTVCMYRYLAVLPQSLVAAVSSELINHYFVRSTNTEYNKVCRLTPPCSPPPLTHGYKLAAAHDCSRAFMPVLFVDV